MQYIVLPKADKILQVIGNQQNKVVKICPMKGVDIGKEIKKVIDKRGLTQAQFAQLINKTRQTVQDILKRKSIDTDLLMKISEVLGFDFFALYTMEQPYVIEIKNELKNAEHQVKAMEEQNIVSRDLNLRQREDIRIMLLANTVFLYSKTTVIVTLHSRAKLIGVIWDIDTTNAEEVSLFYRNKSLAAFGLILSETSKDEKHIKMKRIELGNVQFIKQYVTIIDLREVDSVVLFEKEKGLSMN